MDVTSAVRESSKSRSSESRFDEVDRCGGALRRDPTPVDTLEAFEARWFVPGRRPPRLWRPDRRPRARVDTYHDQSLRVTFSLKRRGDLGPWERKQCVQRAHVVLFGDAAVAEMWTKESPQLTDPPAGSWTAVRKRVWRRAGVEVVDLRLADERWWSIALKLRTALPAFGALERLVGMAASEGFSGSYPAWLIEAHGLAGPDA
jgi:hypothetical protein